MSYDRMDKLCSNPLNIRSERWMIESVMLARDNGPEMFIFLKTGVCSIVSNIALQRDSKDLDLSHIIRVF
jgi:hypothetical protein